MKILLIGAYGFIGSAATGALAAAGHEVIGFGRSAKVGSRILPHIEWREGDLNHLANAALWSPFLEGIDAVVNASGALQSGGGDQLIATQGGAIVALIEACEAAGILHFVQISAGGALPCADTEFMRTKATADGRLKASSLDWAILRPGLVIGRNAYGGTALIRSLAAVPFILATVHGKRHVQCVSMDDLCAALIACVGNGGKRDIDLVEREAHTLQDIVGRHRAWLGIAPPVAIIDLPEALARPVGAFADLLGHLGWRSPLRSTALRVMAADIRGNPKQARAALGREPLGLSAMLERHPAGIQDRWHARLTLLLPMMILVLFTFWISSGVIGLARSDAAAALLAGTGIDRRTAGILVFGGSVSDIAVGVALLHRRTAKMAAIGMVALTLGYLIGGTILRPDLWLDPLAPLAKAIPAMMLALVVYAMLDER